VINSRDAMPAGGHLVIETSNITIVRSEGTRKDDIEAGDYTVMIGGNDIANKTAGTALTAHGLSVMLTVTPAPGLSIAPKVFVAWPSGVATNWLLQSASSVNAANWTGVTNTPVIVDGQPGVVLDSSAGQQFFRWHYAP